jgi:hypothetical protein
VVVLCHSQEQAVRVKAQLAEWLTPRGLAFNEDKTKIVHLSEGFDTLGVDPDDAITRIHEAARGKPRAINNLALAALIATCVTGKTIVDHAAARAAVAEVITTD